MPCRSSYRARARHRSRGPGLSERRRNSLLFSEGLLCARPPSKIPNSTAGVRLVSTFVQSLVIIKILFHNKMMLRALRAQRRRAAPWRACGVGDGVIQRGGVWRVGAVRGPPGSPRSVPAVLLTM